MPGKPPFNFVSNKNTYLLICRGVAVGIYTTNSPEACYYCAENSRANIIVVQDEKQLEKILAFRHKLPQLKAIVQYEGKPNASDILSVSDLNRFISKLYVHIFSVGRIDENRRGTIR